jgi:outer membrane protein TolC
MKDLFVLKKYLIACSLLLSSLLHADELGDILSDNKALLFDYQFESNELESDKLSKSWINPIQLRYSKNYTTQFGGDAIHVGTYSVMIDQPIFRSGGIYYAIKYSDALRHANESDITLQKRKMIGDAVSILFNLKKTKLEQRKMRLLIKNDTIDIHQKRDSYEAGLLDSSFLDQAILKKSQDEATLLEMELNLLELKQRFSLLSDKNPEALKVPVLKLMSKESYTAENLDLRTDRLRAEVSEYNEKITWAKYLPTVSLQGQYINGDINPLFVGPGSTLQEQYYNYGFSVSMPIDVNAFSDIEASKVEKLRAAVQVLDRKETVQEEYQWIYNSLNVLDKKIALAKKDEKIYQNLFRVTKNLANAGEKTSLDTAIMNNSLQIRKLDQKIYKIDKQIRLLKLYVRMENVL